MTAPKYILPVVLFAFSAAAHGAIYQCGSTFQGHPCRGANIRSGAPTTDDDQSGARYAGIEAQRHARLVEREAPQQAMQGLKKTLHAKEQTVVACEKRMEAQDAKWTAASPSGMALGYSGADIAQACGQLGR
jgi:hypothetical protein